MKKKNFNIVKYLALFFGLAFILGAIWYSPKPELKTIYFFLLNLSTGFALLLSPIIPDKLLKYIVVKVLIILLIIVGGINNIRMMYGDLTFTYGAEWDVFLMRLIALYFLVIIFFRTIKPASIK